MAALLLEPPPACSPPPWVRGGHVQTLLGELLGRDGPDLGDQPVRIPLSDGDQLAGRHRPGKSGVQALLFHGLSGTADAHYMRAVSRALAERGHGFLRVDHRGCGEGTGLARHPFHAGRHADLAAVVAFAREQTRATALVVVGFSLSGNTALLLAADPALPRPDAVLAVNPPVDLADCVQCLGSGLNRLYERHFLRGLTGRFEPFLSEARHEPPADGDWRRILWAFDEGITAPLAGFSGAEEYYRRCSAAARLARISVPSAILSAKDDPFVRPGPLVAAARSASEDVFLHMESFGGHLGYLDRLPRPSRAGWLPEAVVHFVEALSDQVR